VLLGGLQRCFDLFISHKHHLHGNLISQIAKFDFPFLYVEHQRNPTSPPFYPNGSKSRLTRYPSPNHFRDLPVCRKCSSTKVSQGP